MNYDKLKEKRDFVVKNIHLLKKEVIDNYEMDFDIEFAHNSTAIEGNTLTLLETKMILEDKLSVGTKKLREIYEVVNHDKAWSYVKECVSNKKELNEEIVKEIHSLLMANIMIGGIYRNVEVRITGAKHTPPSFSEAYYQLQSFYESLKDNNYNDFELAAYTHAEFVRIYPFVDGNGRTSRIIMNYQLLKNGYLPISISNDDRFDYYEALDEYAISGNLEAFIKLIYELEDKKLDFYIEAINASENL